MSRSNWIRGIGTALLCLTVWAATAQAQVIEQRKGQSNPGTIIFKTTLYGAGTGLVLGGAYALVKSDNSDVSTGDALKWGVAGGAAAGAVIGVIYVLLRPEPKGTASSVGGDDESLNLAPPVLHFESDPGPVGTTYREVRVGVLHVDM